MKTAIFSVIFPGNINFFSDFIGSVNRQSTLSFDLFLINDGVAENELNQYLLKLKVNYVVYPVSGLSIIGNRIYGLQKLSNAGYEYIVFADTDDLLSPNRVEASIESLKSHDVVFNDLCTVNETAQIIKKHYWKDRIKNTRIDRDFLIDKNVLGLGNTAIKSRLLNDFSIEVKDDIIAFDWLLFWYLLQNKDACFIKDAYTLYRQYDDNCIGLKNLTLERIQLILKVKQRHYKALIGDFPFLEKNLIDVESLQKKMDASKSFNFIENIPKFNFFWWEETNYLNEI